MKAESFIFLKPRTIQEIEYMLNNKEKNKAMNVHSSTMTLEKELKTKLEKHSSGDG